MTDVFEVPRFLEQDWKDWWTINDYIAQGKSHISHPKRNKHSITTGNGTWLFRGGKGPKHQ